jgi:SAM-dependent methyltransferase
MKKGRTVVLLALALTFLLAQGFFSVAMSQAVQGKPALDVPYEPTTYEIAAEMIRMADVTGKDLVYDLGCGDGRILIMTAKELGARGIGVDLDPDRIRESEENARRAGITHLVRFFRQNLFETDIKGATVVMLYLWPEVNLKLRPKLLNDLRPGTRVVSHSHTMGEWEPDLTRTAGGDTLYLFVVPANVTGLWRGRSQDGKETVFRVTQKFQKVSGTLTAGAAVEPFSDGVVKGEVLRFSAGKSSFEGHVSGDRLEGQMIDRGTGAVLGSWTATRDASSKVSIAE